MESLTDAITVPIFMFKKNITLSYILIFAFHSDINMVRVIVQRNSNHSLNQLCDVSYLPIDVISLVNQTTRKQLKNVIKVGTRNVK